MKLATFEKNARAGDRIAPVLAYRSGRTFGVQEFEAYTAPPDFDPGNNPDHVGRCGFHETIWRMIN